MKKLIIDTLKNWGWIKRPAENTADLSVKLIVLRSNISICKSYEELISCEKMFQWYVDKYAKDEGLHEFKKEVIKLLQYQRLIIQLFTTQTFGHGSPI